MKRKHAYVRRYTRTHRRKNRAWLLAALAAGAALYLALAMGAGAWAHEWLFGADEPEKTEQTENEHEDAEALGSVNGQEITETVAFPAMENYALCVSLPQEASAQAAAAASYRARGGAGLVHEGKALLAVYGSRSDCESVAQALGQELDTEILPLSAGAVELRLTALPQRIDGVRDAFSLWQQTVQHMDALWQDLDSGVATTAQALGRMQEKRDILSKACDAAFDDALLSGRSDALEGFYGVIRKTLAQMDALLLDPPENVLEVSAGIKYTGIRALLEYQLYVESLGTE